MSKKNKRKYRPRHARSEDAAVQALTEKRSFEEKQLQMDIETASEPVSEHYPDLPVRRSAVASHVRPASIEEQQRSFLEAASDTLDESTEIEESAEITEETEIEEDAQITEDAEIAEEAEIAEAAEITAETEAEESAQEEESAVPADNPQAETENDAREHEPDETLSSPEDFVANIAEEDDLAFSVFSAEEEAPEEQYDETFDLSEESEKKPRKKKKKKWKRVLIVAVSIPLALIIALLGAFFVMREMGRRSILESKKFEIVLPTQEGSDNQIALGDQYGRIINYNGVPYVYNNDIVALTFIGIDDGHGSDKELKMADAIYVLAINTKTGKVKLLNISRDIVTDVDVYSREGEFIDTEQIQIAYSNAYTKKGMTGGENTNISVSRLLYGLPMENYFELDLGAVSTLNDAVRGVTVTSAMTFTSPEDGRTIHEGEVVTLHGKEAEYYVRRRDVKELTSNNDRMQRQQDYIMSFLGSIVPEAKKNPAIISELYTAISENSETSLSASELIYIASFAIGNLRSVSDVEIVKFDGEIVAGINAEMYVTDEEILSKMLDIFYEPLNTESSEASESTTAADPSDASAQNNASEAAAAPQATAAVQETKAVSPTTAG